MIVYKGRENPESRVKLFAHSGFNQLIAEVKSAYKDHHLEVWDITNPCDLGEYITYGLKSSDLPVLLECDFDNELKILGLCTNYDQLI